MKNGMLTIFRKELARFFGDKRTALGTILLPGILIFAVYTFMGSALSDQFSVDEDFVPTIQAINLPDSVAALAGQAGLDIQAAEGTDQSKALIQEQELDLLAVFPEGFDNQVAAYEVSSGAPAPAVELYYNSASVDSSAAYEMLYALLDGYESSLSNKFDINSGSGSYDLATDADTAGTFLSSMMPMLLMIFLFSGCMSTAPESIAGEKERGTIATLLITPLRRRDLALGKSAPCPSSPCSPAFPAPWVPCCPCLPSCRWRAMWVPPILQSTTWRCASSSCPRCCSSWPASPSSPPLPRPSKKPKPMSLP